ncbi:WhiB family transcriptional regulator [Nonomuraea sp. B12E4]|uniref:WhiB family transcriptional regulator n=1 Tax=Nonomuraea sp. B12E4 TaxID=3153564 RepID=UPI00325F80C9
MATESMIEAASRTDEENALRRRWPSPLPDPRGIVGFTEEELDPVFQGRGSRRLRRWRPDGWEFLVDALGLPEGGPLTPWPEDTSDTAWLAVCVGEARADQVAVEAAFREALAPPAPVADEREVEPAPAPRINWKWQDDAVCKDDGPLFFAPDGERLPEREMREDLAQELCSWCPVQTECLSYALSKPEKEGFWGGLNEAERAAERRRLQRRGLLDQASVLKRCGGCDTVKLVAEFGKDKHAKDGLYKHCRRCVNEAARERRKARQAVAS